jgi:hypothetical protein
MKKWGEINSYGLTMRLDKPLEMRQTKTVREVPISRPQVAVGINLR